MGEDDYDQTHHPEEVGFVTTRGQDMLHQICPESRANTDSGSHRRSKGWSPSEYPGQDPRDCAKPIPIAS